MAKALFQSLRCLSHMFRNSGPHFNTCYHTQIVLPLVYPFLRIFAHLIVVFVVRKLQNVT